jgi:hypothetical protein
MVTSYLTCPSFCTSGTRESTSQLLAVKFVLAPRVVLDSPLLDYDLCLLERVKNLSVQAFITQFPIETLAVAVLLWASRFDVQRSSAQLLQPLSQFLGNELRAIVRTNVFRNSPEQHHVCQSLDHFIFPEPSCYTDGQTLPRVFITQRQHPQRSSIMRHCAHEVVAPNGYFFEENIRRRIPLI